MGEWIGWRMVRAYLDEHPDTSWPPILLAVDPQVRVEELQTPLNLMSERTSRIRFNVRLDENHVPERIDWEADDGGSGSCSALAAQPVGRAGAQHHAHRISGRRSCRWRR